MFRNTLVRMTGLTLAVAAAITIPSMSSAHHSFAMFDASKQKTISGTVSKFRFSNPHVYIVIDVAEKPGAAPTSYLFEGPTPAILGRLGWNRTILKPGDKVKMQFHPMRDGKPGGNALRLWLPSGKMISLENEDIKY
ncbi:DUF6152 family protein [Sphingobium sp. CAP-1]|uniref:DUF6152 family protein n=1 Tax=Sphingobium sp. CAP-1 TaxID=2676077 RepID=UPI0012BB2767|nr:DUF6152 family protein [Sphingobium sp. CAP-1]QGP80425.1 hypothetical protein GL174_14890 [Sphingobium sp. CAP-1]